MYDELVKVLRNNADHYGFVGENGLVHLLTNAADAIEELQGKHFMMKKTAEWLAEKVPKWIPVTERLPEEWWPVLGLIQFHDEKEPPAQQVLWYVGNGHWRKTWRGDMIESDVTHWMPLPEPPKEEAT